LWDRNVSSCANVDRNRLLLFDPIAPPVEIESLAVGRDTAIVLTAPWHQRDARRVVETLGAPVYTPLPDSAEHLMEQYGLTAEQVGDGRPDGPGSSARRTRTPRAMGWTSASRRFPGRSRTTRCSGSRAIGP
jgi:hypothetical protein